MELVNIMQSKPRNHTRSQLPFIAPLALCLGLVCTAGAQGTVNFANTASSLVLIDNPYHREGAIPTGPAPVTADMRVALYWFNGGSWAQVGGAAGIGPLAGRFVGGIRGNTDANPSLETFKIVAWQAGSLYPTYESALASGNGALAVGESAAFLNETSGGTAPPASLTGFQGLTIRILVPEPSPALYLALGGGVVMLMRSTNRRLTGPNRYL
jgi:hypothetical protein